MMLIPSASFLSSAGIPSVGRRWSRLSVEIFDATLRNLVRGSRPLRTVHQPMARINARMTGDIISPQVSKASSSASLDD